jgi:hypothetical protein
MALVVPAGTPCRPLYDQVAALKTQIAAWGTSNPTHTVGFRRELVHLQRLLVQSLMDHGELCASAILNSMTYGAQDPNA